MAITTVSKKYQIVVPREVRARMKLRVGARLVLYPLDEERAVLIKQPDDYVKKLRGLGKDLWQSLGGADKYIKQERNSWLKN